MKCWRLIRISGMKARARKGDSDIAWALGDGYMDGCVYLSNQERIHVRRDRKQAEYWLRLSSDFGNAGATNTLAGFLSGEYSRLQESLVLHLKALELGYEMGAYNAAITYSMMGKPSAAFELLQQSYRTLPDETNLLLGICLYAGYGCRRDLQKAESFFVAAAASCEIFNEDRVRALFFINMIRHGIAFSVKKHIGVEQPDVITDQMAVNLFKQLVETQPLAEPAAYALAVILIRLHRFQPARKWIRICRDKNFLADEVSDLLGNEK